MEVNIKELLASQQLINENIKSAKTPEEAEKDKVAAAKRRRTKKKTLESRSADAE